MNNKNNLPPGWGEQSKNDNPWKNRPIPKLPKSAPTAVLRSKSVRSVQVAGNVETITETPTEVQSEMVVSACSEVLETSLPDVQEEKPERKPKPQIYKLGNIEPEDEIVNVVDNVEPTRITYPSKENVVTGPAAALILVLLAVGGVFGWQMLSRDGESIFNSAGEVETRTTKKPKPQRSNLRLLSI